MKSSLATMQGVPSDFLSRSALPEGLTPLDAAARLARFPGAVFFDAALPAYRMGPPVSRLAALPVEIVTGSGPAVWEQLRERLAFRAAAAPGGMAAGWIDYDGRLTFGFYDAFLRFPSGGPAAWCGAEPSRVLCEALHGPPPVKAGVPRLDAFRSDTGREAFLDAIRRAQEWIASGDIYLVNLSHRFSTPYAGDRAGLWALYEALRSASPAPHAAWLALEGRHVLSSSPELFLEIHDGIIRTRPIKGTRPRGADPESDARQRADLTGSLKERAELVMITDLERNDLGKVCEFGSVRVSGLLELEPYAQVFHLVSTVEGRLRAGVDAVEAVRACFPGGSVTGTPKKRAMEVIAELERRQRGLYTGAIGWFGYDGSAQFSIAIRTLVEEAGVLSFDVGSGIVTDSDPGAEWEETLHKAAGILRAAGQNRNGTPFS